MTGRNRKTVEEEMPRSGVSESDVEDATLEWLEGLGWNVAGRVPVPDGTARGSPARPRPPHLRRATGPAMTGTLLIDRDQRN